MVLRVTDGSGEGGKKRWWMRVRGEAVFCRLTVAIGGVQGDV